MASHLYSNIFTSLFIIGLFLLVSPLQAHTQNPFDITPRLPKAYIDSTNIEAVPKLKEVSNNPFDITVPPENVEVTTTSNPKSNPDVFIEDADLESTKKARFRFGLMVFILTLLAFLLTILRNLANKSFQAFLSTNMMNLLFREREGRGIFPFLLLYLMFLINMGIFVFLILDTFQVSLFKSQILSLLSCIGAVMGYILFKHFLLAYISAIFPIQKEISRYNFTIIIFGIIIGLILVPTNLLLTFGPENLYQAFIYITAGIIVILYFYRYFRSLSFASKFLVFHKFHFLLYICIIELTPAIIALKLILDGF